MRDLVVFAIVMGILPTALRRPFVGLVLFSWLAYMRPQDLCWGFARAMRFSFVVALVMLVGWAVHESQARKFWRPDPRTLLMLLLAVFVTISLSMASASIDDGYVMRYYFEFTKIILVALFTTGQIDTRQRLRILLWTVAASLGFYGLKNGFLGFLSGGGTILRGPGGMLEDNNDFALALVMNIPLLYYLGHGETKRWIKRAALAGVFFTMVTVLLTHSRGGFVAMAGTVMFMVWRSGKILQAIGGLILGVAVFFLATPQHVLDRIATIAQGSAESSAGARIKAWGIALRMIEDNPIFGVGLRNFRYNYPRYADNFVEGHDFAYVAHNSYLQVWAEGGSLAFFTYLCLLASVFVSCRWLRRLGRSRADLLWVWNYARMMEATTFGFMIGATFLNRGHFDLIYHWFALVSSLVFVAKREAIVRPAEAPAGAAAGTAPERRVEVRWKRGGAAPLLPRWAR
ncbi:MAG: putative O-glycosylation ligase, exosortase A system-associated [Planctomycetota bacterium]